MPGLFWSIFRHIQRHRSCCGLSVHPSVTNSPELGYWLPSDEVLKCDQSRPRPCLSTRNKNHCAFTYCVAMVTKKSFLVLKQHSEIQSAHRRKPTRIIRDERRHTKDPATDNSKRMSKLTCILALLLAWRSYFVNAFSYDLWELKKNDGKKEDQAKDQNKHFMRMCVCVWLKSLLKNLSYNKIEILLFFEIFYFLFITKTWT